MSTKIISKKEKQKFIDEVETYLSEGGNINDIDIPKKFETLWDELTKDIEKDTVAFFKENSNDIIEYYKDIIKGLDNEDELLNIFVELKNLADGHIEEDHLTYEAADILSIQVGNHQFKAIETKFNEQEKDVEQGIGR